MSRTVAVVLTVVTSLVCGLSGVAVLVIGGLAILGARVREQFEQISQSLDPAYVAQPAAEGAGAMTFLTLCLGVLLLLVPVIVGVVSFRASKPNPSPSESSYNPPPASQT